MKSRNVIAAFAFLFLLLLVACSGDNESSDKAQPDLQTENMKDSSKTTENISEGEGKAETVKEDSEPAATERKVIHNAELRLEVKNLEKHHVKLEDKVKQYGGYIVQSNVFSEDKGYLNGMVIARVPEKSFQKFLSETEATAAKVIERNVRGEDVTEEYVDLESRLKSKKAVEARLLVFMQKAEKTEDLLKISGDLANVQEEIETIVGRMKFLDNQVAYATVTINTFEEKVVVPTIDKKDLNTWGKTKKQFAGSINFLMAVLSGITVFFIGNLPVFIILFAIAFLIYYIVRIRKKRRE
ncbi:DUF4349 domain-containing protein [Bacillus sp. CECT 9360]|uniref:DUF4349 domain-containing protein n=1 Tax=Bacillus sp. CECT 9360 TaxID=2845821 RepID=UPI001E4665B3|nr:DUF4349 domain-containing protein [Bacillus sp. CECT 9360]CAH0344576.1 hypothetical protein BCI9360_00836 [Bacillus sp. CECT 9360]